MFPRIDLMKVFYEANSGSGSGDTTSGNQNDNQSSDNNQQGEPADFETWLNSADEKLKATIKPLFDAHVSKLMNTVKETRRERDDFQKELRDAIKKLDAKSDEAKNLSGIADKLDEANKRADFYEEAPANGCRNPKAAFALVKADNLYTRSGAVDWKSLKEVAPELFGEVSRLPRKKTAGEGTDKGQASSQTMNEWIRNKART